MHRLWSLAAASLIALAALAGAGCEGSDGGQGSGSKGDGACGRTCPDGRSCNPATGRCECTPEPDSCEPFGLICNSAKICVEKPPPGPEVVEWSKCGVPGDRDPSGAFVCLKTAVDESNFWARLCETNEACVDRTSVCRQDPGGSGERVCWFNYCGEDALKRSATGELELDERGDPIFSNGRNWGPCDLETGESSDADAGEGSCLPGQALGEDRFLCHASGARRLGESCKTDRDRNDWEACEQGTTCVPPPVAQKGCIRDEECYSTQYCTGGKMIGPNGVEIEVFGYCDALECANDGDCGPQGFCYQDRCRPRGLCTEVCNGGAAGPDAGVFASCSAEAVACSGGLPDDPGSREHVTAWCEAGCDPFGEDVCTAMLGEEAVCIAAPSVADPLGGSCLAVGHEKVIRGGDGCTMPALCEAGYVCKGSLKDGSKCRPLCICEGDGGWDELGLCLTSASQCGEGEGCFQMELGNPFLGACVALEPVNP